MREARLLAIAMLFGLSLGFECLTAQTATGSLQSVVGTWRLVSQEVRRADNGALDELQSNSLSIGILTYDAAGHMTAQIDRRMWDPTYPYTAYHGTYTVDLAKGTVTHHVETGTLESYTGTDQLREYQLSADGQTLTTRSRRPARPPDNVEMLAELIWRPIG